MADFTIRPDGPSFGDREGPAFEQAVLPADIYLTPDGMNAVFQDLTMAVLGLDSYLPEWAAYRAAMAQAGQDSQNTAFSDSPGGPAFTDRDGPAFDRGGGVQAAVPLNPYYFCRISYQREGQPAWKIDEDVVSLFCRQIDSPYDRVREKKLIYFDPHFIAMAVSYTRAWATSWTFYGQHSFDRARLIKSALFRDASKASLKQANLFLVPDIPAPRRVPEVYDGRWWERVDLTAQIYEAVTEHETVPAIEHVPVTLTNVSINATRSFTVDAAT